MDKTLKITSSNCGLEITKFKDVKINGKDLEEIVWDNLPGLNQYREYSAEISIEIKVRDTDEIEILTDGYSLEDDPKEEESND